MKTNQEIREAIETALLLKAKGHMEQAEKAVDPIEQRSASLRAQNDLNKIKNNDNHMSIEGNNNKQYYLNTVQKAFDSGLIPIKAQTKLKNALNGKNDVVKRVFQYVDLNIRANDSKVFDFNLNDFKQGHEDFTQNVGSFFKFLARINLIAIKDTGKNNSILSYEITDTKKLEGFKKACGLSK